jgi:hypothetical protein
MKYLLHPICTAWPSISSDDIVKLTDDIRKNGAHEAVTLSKDGKMILDGYDVAMACEAADIRFNVVMFDGDDEMSFVIGKSMSRFKLNKSQLSFVGNNLLALKKYSSNHISIQEFREYIIARLGISHTMMVCARAIEKYGSPNIIEFVKSEQVKLRAAADLVRNTPKNEQEKMDAVTARKKGNMLYGSVKSRRIGRSDDVDERKIALADILSSELRPLQKRLLAQSKRHAATVSFHELRLIAGEMQYLVNSWSEGASYVPRTGPKDDLDRPHWSEK